MKAAALVAVALGLCVALPGPIQAKKKPTFCVGKDGKNYAVGDSYVDNEGEACIRYKCAKRKGKFIMKKEKCDCNGGNHGISCCPNYVRGDMVGGNEIKITFSPNTENGCQNSCKVQHPTSIGVTQDHDGTSSCYCEFGSPIVGGSANVYKTCLFSTATSGLLKTIKRRIAATTTTTTAPTTTSTSSTSTMTTLTTTKADSIYFIAGGNGALRDIDLYYPTMANLSCSMSPPPLNNNWLYHTTFYYNNTIHLYGGYNAASTCISYNINMEEWKTHTLNTSRKWGHSSVVLKKRVFIMGGKDASGNNYVGAESTPLPLTDQPVLTPVLNLDYKGVAQCTTKVDEDTLVVTGGYYYGYLSSVIEYNAKTRTTTSLPSMKQPRYQHGCAAVEMDNTKCVIVAGGYNSADGVLETTEMLQMGGSSLTPLGNLNVARYGHSIVVTQSGVMAMGGYDGSRGYLSSVELLDWSTMSWRIVQPSLSKSRGYFGGAVEIPASMFRCQAADDGKWSAWSKFTACSATCGNTTKTRSRTCSNPSPSNGGKPCPGLDEEVVSCGLSPCGFNMAATCDDVMWLFADGDLLVNNSSDWRVTSEVHIPACTKVIEIHCLDSWIHGGILASSDNGLITDGAWNCSSDNRTTWNPAYLLGRNGRTAPDISPEAVWIWTDMSHWMQTDHRRHTKAICKIELDTSQCPEPPVCPPFGELTPTTISTPTPAPTTTTTLTTSKPKPGFNLTATCDNEIKLFVDGNLLATSSNWRDTSGVNIPANTEAIEIHCMDTGTVGGILASSDNGLLTDGTWNCSSDNGTTWNPAHEVGPNSGAVPDISPEAEWIWTGCIGDWTSKYTGKKYQKNIICKIDLKPVIDGGWSTWRPFSPCSATCADATKARTRTCSQPSPNNGGNPCLGLEEEVVSCGLSPCGEDSCPYTDKYMDCPQWKNHCESGQWEKCVKENCPKTCNCTDTINATTITRMSTIVDMCTGDFYENGRPPAGTKCIEKNNKMCYIESGRWGKSWCHTEVGGWGAECVKCSALTEDSVYFISGGYFTPRDIQLYHPAIENLMCSITPPPLENDFKHHTSFYHNNAIYLCGGLSTASLCISYHTKTNSWKTHTLPQSRNDGSSSVVFGNTLYLIGDFEKAISTPLPLTTRPIFTSVSNIKYTGYRQCVIKIDEENLIITGGDSSSKGFLTSVTQYNIRTQNSISLPSLQQARRGHGCINVEMDNKKWLIVAGGFNGSYIQTSEMLQLAGTSWVSLGDLNFARDGTSIIETERGVLIMGGYAGNGKELNSVELLEWSTKRWKMAMPSLEKNFYFYGGAVRIPASMFGCAGCGESDHGIPCCPEYITGDMEGGSEVEISFSPKTEASCRNACKDKHPTSIGVTLTPDESRCFCEFAPIWLNGNDKKYKTCVFSSSNSEVYFIAGRFDFGFYSPAIKTLNCSITPPPVNNWERHTSFYHDNTIYVYGGSNTESTCISYRSNTKAWKIHTLPTSRKRHSTVVLKNTLYIIGGINSAGRQVGVESTPLPLTDRPILSSLPNLDYKGERPCATKLDEDNLIVIGGLYPFGYLSFVKQFNAKTGTTTSLPSLKEARESHGCLMAEMDSSKWLMVSGGTNKDNKRTRSTEMLQVGTDSWVSLGNLKQARLGHGMVVTQRGIMVIGGQDTNYDRLDSVELLDWDSKQWRVVQPSLNYPISDFGGALEIPHSMLNCQN